MTESPSTDLSPITPQMFPPRNRHYICGNQDFAKARETDDNRPGINSRWHDYNQFCPLFTKIYCIRTSFLVDLLQSWHSLLSLQDD